MMVMILVAGSSRGDGDMRRRILPGAGLTGVSMVFLLLSWFTCLCREWNSDQRLNKNSAGWASAKS